MSAYESEIKTMRLVGSASPPYVRPLSKVITAITVIGLLATACSSSTTSQAGGTLSIGVIGFPQSMHPNLLHEVPGFDIYRAVYDSLTIADATNGGKLLPDLATSWTLLDPTTWQFKLRENVKWSDGSPFTADDAVATIKQVITSSPPFQYQFRISDVTDATVVDKFTLNVKTKSLNVLLPVGISDIYINQAKQISEGGNDSINSHPVGTGPFMFDSRVTGVSVTLVNNPNYWGTKSKLNKLIFKSEPDDATRIAALQSGEIDIAEKVPPDSAALLKSKGFAIDFSPIGQSDMVMLKSPASAPNSPLANQTVRQAMNYAVDEDSIIKNLLLGYTTRLDGQTVGKDGNGYNPDVKPYPYDPQKAKAMLAQAGYPNGFSMKIITQDGVYTKSKEIVEAIASQLSQVGIKATVQLMDHGTMIQKLPDLESNFVGWNYFPVMDADFDLQWFLCASRFKLMCDPKFDALFAAQRSEQDPQKRTAILQQLQVVIHDDAPAIILHQEPSIWVASSKVTGFTPTPDNVIHFVPIGSAFGSANITIGGSQ